MGNYVRSTPVAHTGRHLHGCRRTLEGQPLRDVRVRLLTKDGSVTASRGCGAHAWSEQFFRRICAGTAGGHGGKAAYRAAASEVERWLGCHVRADRPNGTRACKFTNSDQIVRRDL